MTILGLLFLTSTVAIVAATANSEYWPFGFVVALSVSIAIPFTVPSDRKRSRRAAWLSLLPLIYVLAFGPYIAALNAYTGKPWSEYDIVMSRVIFPGHVYILERPLPNKDSAMNMIRERLKEFSRAWTQFGFSLHSFVNGFASEIAASTGTPPRI
jgi:hypothetical protein